jgi:glycosyltransferase involved in cell wall biosynthesis
VRTDIGSFAIEEATADDAQLKKVAFVTPYFWPCLGGMETATREMASGLRRLGWSVDVHTSCWRGMYPPKVGSELDPLSGLTIHRYRTPRAIVAFVPRFRNPMIVHVHSFNRLLVALTLGAHRSGPRILHPHGNISMVPAEPPSLSRSLRRTFDSTIGGSLLRRVDRLFCLKSEEEEAMVAMGAKPASCRLIPEPVTRASIRPRDEKKEDDLIVYVGRVVPLKCVEHAIQAIARLRRGRLAIVGPCPDERYLRKLRDQSERLGVSERVSFVGDVSHEDVPTWFRRATASVLCSRIEGQGLVVSEATLQGAWPIGTEEAVGCLIREMGAGGTYRWGNVEELSSLFAMALNNSPAVRHQSDRAREWVIANLHPDVVTGRIAAEYEDLVAGRHKVVEAGAGSG